MKHKHATGRFTLCRLLNPSPAVSDRIKGVKFSALEGAFWNIYELKVSDK